MSWERFGNCLALAMSAGLFAQSQSSDFRASFDGVLGTSMDLVVRAANEQQCQRVVSVIRDEISRLNAVLSSYDPNSEFCRARARTGSSIEVSEDLLAVLRHCCHWRAISDHAFDPSPRGVTAWTVDSSNRVTLIDANDATLDGLAKGYVIDRALDRAFREVEGLEGLVIDIGGDVHVRGTEPRTIAVADPQNPADNAAPLYRITLTNGAVATSGRYARGRHIHDARTGKAAGGAMAATVIAPNCADADAAATLLNVLEPDAGVRFIDARDGFECLIVACDGSVLHSRGFKAHVRGDPVRVADASHTSSSAPAAWPANTEVAFNFEIQRPAGIKRGSYRRPYVAAWIEDDDGKPVKTLALWIEGRRWLRDLRTWYRLHRRDSTLIETVSRATRRPGAYELVWKGRDDAGNVLPRGRYTVCFEIAREHGTHQIARATVDVGDSPSQVELDASVEASNMTVRVRKRGASR